MLFLRPVYTNGSTLITTSNRILYDPTNGTVSTGDIFRAGGQPLSVVLVYIDRYSVRYLVIRHLKTTFIIGRFFNMDEQQKHFCPKCGRNYLPGRSWCDHCNVKLVAPDTYASSKELFEQNTVTVHVAETPLQAELLREILETNGILCALVGTVPSNLFRFTVDGLAKVRILVLESVADEAREIIHDALASLQTNDIEPGEEDDNENSDSE